MGSRRVLAPSRLQWTGFFVSWTIAAAAWIVGESIVPRKPSRPDEIAASPERWPGSAPKALTRL